MRAIVDIAVCEGSLDETGVVARDERSFVSCGVGLVTVDISTLSSV